MEIETRGMLEEELILLPISSIKSMVWLVNVEPTAQQAIFLARREEARRFCPPATNGTST